MTNLDRAMARLTEANQSLLEAKRKLRTIEVGIRKHGYPVLIKATNSQKMQLEFEHLAATDPEDFQEWQRLVNNVEKAEAELFEAQIDYDVAFMREKNATME